MTEGAEGRGDGLPPHPISNMETNKEPPLAGLASTWEIWSDPSCKARLF